jgi:hypothetical protein
MGRGWTLERRQRQSEKIRGWQPWKQSTGARTPEGKTISKMNAIKHCGYSSTTIATLKQIKKILNYNY